MGDLGQPPGRTLCPTSHHHPVGAAFLQRLPRRGRVHDIAVGDDRDRDGVLHRPDRRPVGATLVELTPRAAVDHHHAHPGAFGPLRQFGGVEVAVIPAQPGLQRDRHLHRARHRLDQPQRQVQVAQQGRSAQARRHPLGRAAHVDVDDARPLPFAPARGLGHQRRFAARQLHAGRHFVKAQFRPCPRLGPRPQHLVTGDHLAHYQPRAEPPHQPAERQIGDSRQRSQQDRRMDVDGAKGQGHGCFPSPLREQLAPGVAKVQRREGVL